MKTTLFKTSAMTLIIGLMAACGGGNTSKDASEGKEETQSEVKDQNDEATVKGEVVAITDSRYEAVISAVEPVTGIKNFGMPKGYEVMEAYSFVGSGDLSNTTCDFIFRFKSEKPVKDNELKAYAQVLFDASKDAADGGELFIIEYKNKKSEEKKVKSLKNTEDKGDYKWRYRLNGIMRSVEVRKEGTDIIKLFLDRK